MATQPQPQGDADLDFCHAYFAERSGQNRLPSHEELNMFSQCATKAAQHFNPSFIGVFQSLGPKPVRFNVAPLTAELTLPAKGGAESRLELSRRDVYDHLWTISTCNALVSRFGEFLTGLKGLEFEKHRSEPMG